ncbi:unnamed protein product [Closterium sp. NIES-65]|nr:unnamed protein product [Closterium sp. NIES-65]
MAYVPTTPMGVATGTWTTGLCGCCEDIPGACCTYFCPCVILGRNVNIVTDGFTESSTACCLFFLVDSLTLGLCGFVYSCGYRTRLRQKYDLPESPCGDCLTHLCCLPCALCQENRELKNRGWDPKLGFASNVRIFRARGQEPPPQVMQR